jgi:hydrogenase maturation protease
VKTVLVGGVGNVLFGDDGFGVEVVRRLARRALPENVRVVDFGIRGADLGYALRDADRAIVIDALSRGGAPGTLYVLEPSALATTIDAHAAAPQKALALASALGETSATIRIVGCEPARLVEDDELVMGLSDPVAAVVDDAVALVEKLIAEVGDA